MTVQMRKLNSSTLFLHLDNGDSVNVPNNVKWAFTNQINNWHVTGNPSYLNLFTGDKYTTLNSQIISLIHASLPTSEYSGILWLYPLTVTGEHLIQIPWNLRGLEMEYGQGLHFINVGVGAWVELLLTEKVLSVEPVPAVQTQPATSKKGGWNF